MEKKLRWGILGTAQIARKNWQAIRNSGNSTIVAVASRNGSRSRSFIDECQAEVPFEPTPRSLNSYEELIAAQDVDAVYIPLPTALRKEWVIRAAQAGKHVICEKPCAPSVGDLTEMLEACRRNSVQFMDGVMFVHSQRFNKIREVLGNGESVGTIKRIASGFSFCAPNEFLSGNIRMHSELEPHGCLGDLGWYCIRFVLAALDWQLPRSVTGRMLSASRRPDSPAVVPTEFSGELFFEGNVSASFYCSFVTAHQQWVHVSGTKGCLQVPDFVLPYFGSELSIEVVNSDYQIRGCEFNMEPHVQRLAIPEYSNSHPNAQETNLFRNFASQVQSGSLSKAWPDMVLKTQQVMNACYDSARMNGQYLSWQ